MKLCCNCLYFNPQYDHYNLFRGTTEADDEACRGWEQRPIPLGMKGGDYE